MLRALAISVPPAELLRFQFAHHGPVYRSRPTVVDVSGLGFRNAFKLALSTQVRLKLREHPKHVEEPLARRGAIGCSVAFSLAPLARSARTILKVTMLRARRSIRVTMRTSPLRKQSTTGPQFLPPLRCRAAVLLSTDRIAARGLQRRFLDREVLIGGRYPGVAMTVMIPPERRCRTSE